MTRLRPRLRPGLGLGLLAPAAALVAARGQQPRGPDPERAFAFGDTDLDGKLSLDEFRELLRNGARLKNAAGQEGASPNPELLFRRLDADSDGVLTIAEYRQIVQLRAGRPAGRSGRWRRPARPGRRRPAGARGRPPRRSPSGRSRAEQARFFETKIRPVLTTKCDECHSADAEKVKGGLLVDSPRGAPQGGRHRPGGRARATSTRAC